MQFIRLNETCRIIGYSLNYQMMSTLLKLGLSGYDVKLRFGAFQCEYLLQNQLFLVKTLVALDTHAKKINPPSNILGGGMQGKACWLIA